MGDVTADVRWAAADTSTAEALTDHAHTARGPGLVEVGQLCHRCGSSRHGRPWLRLDGRKVHVSVARSGPHLLTVVAAAPVGVDVESVDAVGRGWHADLVCTASELADPPGTTSARAAMWVAKEAVLKQRGTGLATPMTEVSLAAYDVQHLRAPDGYVAAVCTGRAGSSSS